MIVIFLMLTIVAACSQQKEKIVETSQFLDVQLAVNPVQGNMNEVITFEAKVMYGDKEVTDPDEVYLKYGVHMMINMKSLNLKIKEMVCMH